MNSEEYFPEPEQFADQERVSVTITKEGADRLLAISALYKEMGVEPEYSDIDYLLDVAVTAFADGLFDAAIADQVNPDDPV